MQLAAAGGLLVMYLAAWPLVRPWDPQGPATFIPYGNWASLATLCGFIWLLAAAIGFVTFSARPQGAMVAVVVAAGGVSLHSGMLRQLLWLRQGGGASVDLSVPDYGGQISPIYWQLATELVVLAAVIMVAGIILGLSRAVVARLRPTWMWRSPVEQLSPAPPVAAAGGGGLWALGRLLMLRPGEGSGESATARKAAAVAAGYLTMAAAVSLILLLLTMRSADRGQILFALAVSLMLGTLAAHQVFPADLGLVTVLLPLGMALAFYAAGGSLNLGPGPQNWMLVKPYATALPLDWMTAGVAGALGGYWISCRLHESRLMEKHATGESDG